jgi:tetratricopeptide (TPR) repeat protein
MGIIMLMKEPTTPEEVLEAHKVLRSDPQRYLECVNEWLSANPQNAHAHFDRHFAWMRLGEPRRALEDLDKAIAIAPDQASFLSRGEVHRHLGAYDKALGDFARGEALDEEQWRADAIGLLFQADCHARLGEEDEALARCARLPDDFWTPGLDGAPSGDKHAIAPKLRVLAAEARAAKR